MEAEARPTRIRGAALTLWAFVALWAGGGSASASTADAPGPTPRAELAALLAKVGSLPAAEQLPLLNRIAEIQLDAKLYPEAVRWAERALASALDRRNAWETIRARLTLGTAHYKGGDLTRALEQLRACRESLAAFEGGPGEVSEGDVAALRIRAYSQLGLSYQRSQDEAAALEAYRSGIETARATGDDRAAADLLCRTALIHHVQGEYEKALTAGVEAVERARAVRNPGLLANCEYALGYIYRDLNRYDTALDFFQSALGSAEAAGDAYRKALALNEIGNIYALREDYPNALAYKRKALDAALASNDEYTVSCCLHDIGEVHMRRGDPAAALTYLQRALAIDTRRGDEREIAITSQNLGQIYLGLGRIADAQRTLESALPIVEKGGHPVAEAEIYGLLSAVHERRGAPALALDFLRRSAALKESVLREEGSRRLQELQTRYETEKKQQENEALAQENRIKELALTRQTAIRHNLIALSVLLVLIVALVYNRYRLRVRAHRELERAHGQITAQKNELDRANLRLEELSRQDPLTGLSNRRDLEEKIEEERLRFGRTGRPFALLMADLDDFKAINDTRGHDCGDFVLKTLAGVLTASLRKLTWIGRWGGDEFLLLLPETNLPGARRVAEKIREQLARTPFLWEGRRLDVRLSIGVAVIREGLEVEDLLREADQDMYRKKRGAKARTSAALS